MSTQPRKDSDFIAWIVETFTKCAENQEKWKLNADDFTKFARFTSAAKSAYDANSGPAGKNADTVNKKDETFRQLREFLSLYFPTLTANTNIANDELASMKIKTRVHVRHYPVAVPSVRPGLELVTGEYRLVKVYVCVPRFGGTGPYVKADPRYKIAIRYRVEGEEKWTRINSSRIRNLIKFEEDQVGKRVYVMAAWTNPRLQEGDWCDPVSVLIN